MAEQEFNENISDVLQNTKEINSASIERLNICRKLTTLNLEHKSLDENNGLISKKESPDKVEKQTNRIFNALGKRILKICNRCVDIRENADKYLEVASALISLYESISKIGEGNLKLHQLKDKNERSENKVSYFQSDPFIIEGKEVSLYIHVRPSDDIVVNHGKRYLKAQARTSIEILSKDSPTSSASVRIDPPDRRINNNIVFDITVTPLGGTKSIIDELDLKQIAGHHFNSGISINEIEGSDISQIHEAVINRLDVISESSHTN